MRAIGIGDNVCDKYLHQQTMYPGGQALNFAVYAGMLGVPSAYLGVFGSDTVAQHVQKTLDECGVDRSHCRQYPGENGYAMVNLVDGDRIFLGSNKGGVLREHPIQLNEADLAYIKEFQLCHTTNNSYMDDQLARLKETGIALSYDFSGQWIDEARVDRVAPYVDYAFLSCGSVELEQAQEICRKIHSKGAGMVVATRGSKGAVLFDGTDFYPQPPRAYLPGEPISVGVLQGEIQKDQIRRALRQQGLQSGAAAADLYACGDVPRRKAGLR